MMIGLKGSAILHSVISLGPLVKGGYCECRKNFKNITCNIRTE